MPSRQLHTQRIPADTLTSTSESLRRRTREAGSLTESPSPVESIAVEPGTTQVEVTYRGNRAKLMAKELAGLFDAPNYDVVAYFGVGEATDADGYYVPADSADEPAEVRAAGAFYTVAGTMRKRGTRRSHFRSMTTKPTTVDNDFGNDDQPIVAINDAARQTRWFNPRTGAVETATPLGTRGTEHGTVARYDANDATFEDPALIFDLPYSEEGSEDVRVWDDRGGSRTDADGNVRWRKVYHPRYDPEGSFVLANDILRVYLNDRDDSVPISAERWDESAGSYADVSLGTSDWEVAFVDVRRIGTSRLKALVTFENASDGSRYTLVGTLTRGDENVLWSRTPNASDVTPSGLIDLLDPIASSTRVRTGENDDITPVEEVDE